MVGEHGESVRERLNSVRSKEATQRSGTVFHAASLAVSAALCVAGAELHSVFMVGIGSGGMIVNLPMGVHRLLRTQSESRTAAAIEGALAQQALQEQSEIPTYPPAEA